MEGSMAFVTTAEEGIVWGLDQSGALWLYDMGQITIQDIIKNEEEGWTLVTPDKLV
jgi:hypothetical protein